MMRTLCLLFVVLAEGTGWGCMGRSLPYCDGNVLHYSVGDNGGVPFGGAEGTVECAKCMESGGEAQCVALPETRCSDSVCSPDGQRMMECGPLGYLDGGGRWCKNTKCLGPTSQSCADLFDSCRTGNGATECILLPETSCTHDMCIDDGKKVATCGVTGFVTDYSECGTWVCREGNQTAECYSQDAQPCSSDECSSDGKIIHKCGKAGYSLPAADDVQCSEGNVCRVENGKSGCIFEPATPCPADAPMYGEWCSTDRTLIFKCDEQLILIELVAKCSSGTVCTDNEYTRPNCE